MFEMLKYEFMQRALIAGFCLSIVTSFLSIFIVQRRMSFVGSGLAHASFGGVALGLLLGVQPFFIAAPFTVLVAALLVWLSQHSKLESDTIIGVLFSLSMALGIVFLSLRTTYTQDAMTLLFGSLLTVQYDDLWFSVLMLALLLLFIHRWPRWALASFDRELALTQNRRVLFDDYCFAILTALTVVAAIKVFGIILLSAFLVLPAASARILSSRFSGMSVLSIIMGVLSSVLGLCSAYWFDLPTSAAVILVQSGLFVLALILGNLVPWRA